MIANTPSAWNQRAEHGATSSAAALWSDFGQQERFKNVLDALRPEHGETLLDYGCGTGALTELLHPEVDYLGYDWAGGMVRRARAEHPYRRFTTGKPICDFDLTACVGPFNLRDNWSKEQTFALLRELWSHTTRALAVCLFSGRDIEQTMLVYGAPETEGFARSTHANYTLRPHLRNDLLLVLRR